MFLWVVVNSVDAMMKPVDTTRKLLATTTRDKIESTTDKKRGGNSAQKITTRTGTRNKALGKN